MVLLRFVMDVGESGLVMKEEKLLMTLALIVVCYLH
jgi:hypothetical protein